MPMYYNRRYIEKGRKIVNIGVLVTNGLNILDLFYSLLISESLRLKELLFNIEGHLAIIFITFMYYRGNKLAFIAMKFLLNALAIATIIVPIIVFDAVLMEFQLLDFWGGWLYLIVPLILIFVVLFIISKTGIYDSVNEFMTYKKENPKG